MKTLNMDNKTAFYVWYAVSAAKDNARLRLRGLVADTAMPVADHERLKAKLIEELTLLDNVVQTLTNQE